MKGVILDFNGTLFFDSDKHLLAWREYLAGRCGGEMSDEGFRREVLGRPNPQVLRRFLGEGPREEEIRRMSVEKEEVYRRLCLGDPASFHLVRGVPEFLDRLAARGVPVAIATGAERTNLDFYFEHFGLARWFTLERIVYDDGDLPGKPDPDVFLRAARKLGLPPGECLIVEDSLAGVEAARRAGAGRIVAITAGGDTSHLTATGVLTGIVRDFIGMERYLEEDGREPV